MALTEEVVIDKIEILEDGVIQVRQSTRVFRDGVKIAETYHRNCIAPGDVVTGQDARVASVVELIHTDEVKDAYAVKMVAARPGLTPPIGELIAK